MHTLTSAQQRTKTCWQESRLIRWWSCWHTYCQPVVQRSAIGHSRPALLPSCNNVFFRYKWYISLYRACVGAIVCKTVRPLCYRTVVWLSLLCVMSVTLVYCGQTVGWIKTTLGTQVVLDPGDVVRCRPSSPKERGISPPTFRPTLLWHGRPS